MFSIRLFDRKLEGNLEQYTAVCNIVAGISKPAPYLVFGPPGTGKTVTMVEAIKQVELVLTPPVSLTKNKNKHLDTNWINTQD